MTAFCLVPCLRNMKLSFVISTQPTKFQAITFDPNFEGNAAHLAQLGYDGIELGVREPDKLDVANLKQTLAKYRLTVPAIGTGQAFVEEQLSFTDPDASGARARDCARQDAHRARARVREQAHRHHRFDSWQDVADDFARAGARVDGGRAENTRARRASARSIRLAIEPINRYETDWVNDVAGALTLIDEIGADNVGMLFDTFHANIEEPSIEKSLRACGARLFHVHVADSNRWYPGAGHTNFASILATLREMKYAGWVSAEILPKPDVKRAAEETYKTIKPLL